MYNTMNTCRLCKKSNYEAPEPLLKYGKGHRHYVHAHCALKAWGEDGFFERISVHQFGRLPGLWLHAVGGAFEARVMKVYHDAKAAEETRYQARLAVVNAKEAQ